MEEVQHKIKDVPTIANDQEKKEATIETVGGLTPIAGIPRDPFLEIRPGDDPE